MSKKYFVWLATRQCCAQGAQAIEKRKLKLTRKCQTVLADSRITISIGPVCYAACLTGAMPMLYIFAFCLRHFFYISRQHFFLLQIPCIRVVLPGKLVRSLLVDVRSMSRYVVIFPCLMNPMES